MPIMLVLLALGGLAVGSFLNVVIVRVPAHESLLRPRSHCPYCEAPIAARDNIPILSWFLLRGKCRACGEDIPLGYPLVEAANAVLWVLAGLRFGVDWPTPAFAALFSVLLALSVIDLELYLLPDRITYPSIVASLVILAGLSFVATDNPKGAILGALIGGVGYAGFLAVTLVAYELVAHKEGMGIGDIKLAVVLGLWIGWLHPILVIHAIILAGVLSVVVGGIALVVRRTSQPYPFGPWLAIGAIVVILASSPLLDAAGL